MLTKRGGFQVTKDADDRGVVHARVAMMQVADRDGDLILRGAFGRQPVKVSSFGHGSWQGALPVGVGEIHEQRNEVLADLRFFMSTKHGKDHFETIKGLGSLGEWSFGFDILEEAKPTEEQAEKGIRRVLKRLKVHEVSPVLRGAGVGTATLSAKCERCAARAAGPSRAEVVRLLATARDVLQRSRTIMEGPFFGGTVQHNPEARALAGFAAEVGHAVLRYQPVKQPDLTWFRPHQSPKHRGLANPALNAIAVATSLRGADLAETVLHELSHLAGADEPGADAFGRKWAPVVLAAYRWADGQSHRVRVRDSSPGWLDPELRRRGVVTICRPRFAAFTYLPISAGPSWKRIS